MAGIARSADRGSQNAFNVKDVLSLDTGAGNALTSKTYHGISIVSGFNSGTIGSGASGGNIMGRIQTWNPQPYSRDAVHIYELNHLGWGRPVEAVPGRATGYTINAARYETWNSEVERCLGFSDLWIDLTDQNRPAAFQEYWFFGNKAASYAIWSYHGVWVTERNEDSYEAEGDARVRASMNCIYTSRTLTKSS